MSLCFVLGPLVGGLIASLLTLRSPFYFSACIAALEIVLVVLFLKNPKELENEQRRAQAAGSEALLLKNDQTDSVSLHHYHRHHQNRNQIQQQHSQREGISVSRASSFSEVVTEGMLRASFSIPIANNDPAPAELLESPRSEDDDENNDKDLFEALDEEQQLRTVYFPVLGDEDKDTTRDAAVTTAVTAVDTATDVVDIRVDSTATRNPWCDRRALLVGGVGTALNIVTYLGLIALVPLILEEDKFGIVHSDSDSGDGGSDDDGLTSHEVRAISQYMGFYLGAYGCTQVLGMIALFPRCQRRMGLLLTGSLGSLVYGASFFVLLFTSRPLQLFAVCVPMAFGNSLCRPVFPSYLGKIACKERRAEYMAISATFSNVALMIGGQMTLLYSTFSPTGAILLCGLSSILNAILLFSVAWIPAFSTSSEQ
jgi:MFS family permease